jgi:colanic acid/amylovoran biosynthesis glycosyltransferase
MTKKTSLLLDLPLPFKKSVEGYLVEKQALNGLRCWTDNFEKITVCAPVEDATNPSSSSSIVWADPRELLTSRNIVLEPLPMGYHPRDFLKHKKWVYDRFSTLIDEHEYLCFSNIGGIGSWGNFGVDIAIKRNKKYALWFDWVLDQMPSDKSQSLIGNLKKLLDRKYANYRTYHAIDRCDLGLFHGKTVYDAYAPHSKNAQLVHDIHLGERDAITDKQLSEKMSAAQKRTNIKIGYLGRAHPMKAPDDWIEIISQVAKQLGKENVEAVWLGDGPLLEKSRSQVEARSLNDVIKFSGFVSDRNEILNFLQKIDIFLFCHVTPESPRCLIEALISGTPIIGYESAYAADLVGDRGGAFLSKISDIETLVDYICSLAKDKKQLVSLIQQASQNRYIYNDNAVFKHRSELIKTYL